MTYIKGLRKQQKNGAGMARRKLNKEKKYPPGTDIRIFTPGYIGWLDLNEYKFLHKELTKRAGLRKRWFFKEDAKRLSEFHIRHVALYGCPHNDMCTCGQTLKDLKSEGTTWTETKVT